ncbi:MAG: hypothetical protein GX620_12015 [Chloroflexi bacterium]|nr:hypothetical protein [Chloroflexota bacterium]
MNTVHLESFYELGAHLRRYIVGKASLEPCDSVLRFVTTDASAQEYSDAQIDDCQERARRAFLWNPPLRLVTRARFSHPTGALRGTAGFGFWNDPFVMTGSRPPALPRALWFFYASPPSNMKLDVDVAGFGWKAATIDASRPAALAWIPFAPGLMLLMNVPLLYRLFWPPVQRSLCIREAELDLDMTDWHTYEIDWHAARTCFKVDGAVLLDTVAAPRGPLGFVMWLDNQTMVITPWGRFRWGLLDAPGRQWMEVDDLVIESL